MKSIGERTPEEIEQVERLMAKAKLNPVKLPKGCVHDWKYEDDEYGSLADGGSYARYRCRHCNDVSYSQLPD